MKKQKIVLITNIPNEYRIPLFNELHRQLFAVNIHLHVIFGASGYQKRKTVIDLSDCKFSYEILTSGWMKKVENRTGFMFYSGLNTCLKKQKADQIIVAGYSLATMKVWAKSFLRKTSYYIWSGSIHREGISQRYIQVIQRKLLIKRAKGFIAYGSLAKEYFESLGAQPSKIKVVGNTVDTRFFSQETEKIRSSIHKSTKKHLTYIGYLTPRKNVKLLLYVIKELLAYRNDFVLDIIGDGENKAELEAYVKTNKLSQHVNFHGFLQKQELPKYLALSDCFLFQTDFDIWGLVLNEAMASCTPCLASKNAGATIDLIVEGVSGFKVNFEDSKQIAKQIDWILNNPKEMNLLAKKAQEFISTEYNLSKCAERIISIL